MFTACRRKLHRELSPLKMLASPMAASNRLRGCIRCGFLSLFPVFGAGIFTRFEVYSEAGHGVGSGVVGVALIPSQVSPAWNSSSAVNPLRSTAGCPLRVVDVPMHGLF